MSKVGISIKIDVTKIDKTRLYKGAKGTYLGLTTFVDIHNPDQYDQNGFISQETTKEEREKEIKTPILGNCKVFYVDDELKLSDNSGKQEAKVVQDGEDSEDIPF
jgi:hypothetical protein